MLESEKVDIDDADWITKEKSWENEKKKSVAYLTKNEIKHIFNTNFKFNQNWYKVIEKLSINASKLINN